MPTGVELLAVLGPLVAIMPRVFGVLAATMATLAAARVVGGAIRLRRPLLFLVAWFGALATIVAGWLCLRSLTGYGKAGSAWGVAAVEPLSAAGIHHLLASETMPVMWAFGVAGAVGSLLLRRSRGMDVSAETLLLAPHDRASHDRRGGSAKADWC